MTELDFPLDLESVSFPAFDAADVEETFGKYQLASPLARVLAMIDAEPPSREAKLEVAPMLEGDAVSYTHLDVYKRQGRYRKPLTIGVTHG